MKEKKNGKKFAAIIVGTMLVASIAVVIVITAFYELYDPTKYGRSNGGVDQGSKPQTEQIENNDEK